MTTLALNSLSRSSARSPLLSKSPQTAVPHFRQRWMHQTLCRQAIMMPAMSPFMTVGKITSWKKKEGEAFARGDVLLQIESDIATIDVEAETAGILGKILVPDGSADIPVEQVIALVVNNNHQLASPSLNIPGTPPPYNPPSRSLASPARETFIKPFLSPTLHSPCLGEMHPGYQHHRGMAMRHARRPQLTIVPPSPRITVSLPIKSTPSTNIHASPSSGQARERVPLDSPVDGTAVRRMFLSTLSRAPLSALSGSQSDTRDYFDGIL